MRNISKIGYAVAITYDEAASGAECAEFNRLFHLKCNNLLGFLQIFAEHVDGFATSSLFEAQLAREVLGEGRQPRPV